MKKYIKNIIISLICFVLIIILNFILPRLLGGDPVANLTGLDEKALSEGQYQYYYHALHLDENIFVQFGYYIKSLLDGTLGYSYKKDSNISNLILSRIGPTLEISFIAIIISSVIALFWGISSGYKHNINDKISTPLNVMVNAIPSFAIGIILLIIFAFKFKWFPYNGLNSSNSEGTVDFLDRIYHLILPISTLVIAILPSQYLYVRNLTRNEVNKKYVLYVRERGLSTKRIKYSYILKNIISPYIVMVAISLGASIGGSVVIENLFSINGMGTLLSEGISNLDYPLIQGELFVISLIVVIMIIISDIICIILNPHKENKNEN